MAVRHWLNLEGARAIATEPMKATIRAVESLVQRNAIGAIYGDSGLGKSFAIEYAAALMRRRRGVEPHIVVIGERPNQSDMLVSVLDELTGRANDGKRRHLIRDLTSVLSERPRLLIVDEAQALNKPCFETLRHIHDDPGTGFALAFVGGHGAKQVLYGHPHLRKRVHVWTGFRKLTADEVMRHMPKYHPLYAEIDQDLLLYIDDYYGHGNFRDWADFTVHAVDVCAQHDLPRVTVDVAKAVFALKTGAEERDAA